MADFKKLKVWEKAHALTVEVYDLTKKLPKEEKHGLVSQLRRAAVSVESNIAEGEGRFSNKEKVQFCVVARGSVAEICTQLLVIQDNFDLNADCGSLLKEYDVLGRMLTNLIKHRRNSNQPTNQLTQGPIL